MKKRLSFKQAEELSCLTEVERLKRGIVEGPYADLGYHGTRKVKALAKRLGCDEDAMVSDAEQRLSQQHILRGEHRYIYERREGYFNNIKTYEIDFKSRDFSCYCYIDVERARELMPEAITEEAARPGLEEIRKHAITQAPSKHDTASAERRRAKRALRYATDPEFRARCDSFGTKPL